MKSAAGVRFSLHLLPETREGPRVCSQNESDTHELSSFQGGVFGQVTPPFWLPQVQKGLLFRGIFSPSNPEKCSFQAPTISARHIAAIL